MGGVTVYIDDKKVKIDNDMARKLRKFAKEEKKPERIIEKLKNVGAKVKVFFDDYKEEPVDAEYEVTEDNPMEDETVEMPEVEEKPINIVEPIKFSFGKKEEAEEEKEEENHTEDEKVEEPEEETKEEDPISEIENVGVVDTNIPVEEEVTSQIGVDTVKIDDLTDFDEYFDYVTAYRKANVADKDSDQFYRAIHNGEGVQGLLTEEEFIDKKRRQLENIQHQKEKQEIADLQKELYQVSSRLQSRQDELDSLKAQHKALTKKLEEARKENITLSNNVTDLETNMKEKDSDIENLNEQISKKAVSLQELNGQIFDLRAEIKDKNSQIRKQDETIETQKRQIEDSVSEKEKLIREKDELKTQVDKLKNNIKEELAKLTPSDSLEETAINWVKTKLDQEEPEENYTEEETYTEDEKVEEPTEENPVIDVTDIFNQPMEEAPVKRR